MPECWSDGLGVAENSTMGAFKGGGRSNWENCNHRDAGGVFRTVTLRFKFVNNLLNL